MTDSQPISEDISHACANCGASLQGEYCPQCGQSRSELKRPVIGLFTDALDGIFTWDGRLFSTYRALFARPGQVARDFMDGKRRRFTPPVRLYLIVSLIFFAAMAASQIRVVSVNITADAAGEAGVFVSMFQPPREEEPVILDAEMQARLIQLAQENGVSQGIQDLMVVAMNNPEILEERASGAASQAMILMVVIFALLNAALHPRRKLIEHVVNALYFHAALLLPFAAIIISGTYLPLPVWAGIGLAIATVLMICGSIFLFDRGFYNSSWIGSAVRLLPMLLGYVTGASLVALGLIFFASL
jgi:Protein of unknown function (DUF3667)